MPTRKSQRLDAISHILPFIFDHETGLIMALGAYFDESIRDGEGSEPLSVAGYVFKPHSYESFRRAWKRVLIAGPTPTTYFHMTNLYARDKQYKGWTVEERAAVLEKAVAAVRKHAFCGVSVLFGQAEFERVAPANWKHEFGSIYSAACQMILQVTAFWMRNHGCARPIGYFFEEGHKFWKEANEILTGIGKDPEYRRFFQYHTHAPLEKESSYGLQAADMLAWIMTKATVGFPDNHTTRAFKPIIRGLAVMQSPKYQLFHPTGETLYRFFREQESNDKRVAVSRVIATASLR